MLYSTCDVHIEGLTPYSPSRRFESPPKGIKPDVWDNQEWRRRISVSEETGNAEIPYMAFKFSVMSIAKILSEKIPGKGMKTYSDAMKSGVSILQSIDLGVKPEDADYIDLWVNSKGMRGASLDVSRRFPIFHKWGGVLHFEIYNDDLIKTPKIFEEYVKKAGYMVGVGRFRPEVGGVNGRWKTTSVNFSKPVEL